MSEVEDVARHIEGVQSNLGGPWLGAVNPKSIKIAEAAIAAATPHIRAALFDELIADAYGPSFGPLDLHCDTGSFGGSEYLGTLIDWLTAHKNKENTQT